MVYRESQGCRVRPCVQKKKKEEEGRKEERETIREEGRIRKRKSNND